LTSAAPPEFQDAVFDLFQSVMVLVQDLSARLMLRISERFFHGTANSQSSNCANGSADMGGMASNFEFLHGLSRTSLGMPAASIFFNSSNPAFRRGPVPSGWPDLSLR
jgi:hypothetical protein